MDPRRIIYTREREFSREIRCIYIIYTGRENCRAFYLIKWDMRERVNGPPMKIHSMNTLLAA